jgi:purine-binding chemotaxis protein CheW
MNANLSEPSATASNRVEKYLTVSLAGESYGLSAVNVREIIRLQKITPLPRMPGFVKGIINLRGRVIPITDLRTKFGLPEALGERTCIVVVQVTLPDGRALPMGLVVDSVEEVANIPVAEIEPAPDFGVHVDTSMLRGMAKLNGQVKTLLNLDRVVAHEDIAAIAAHL